MGKLIVYGIEASPPVRCVLLTLEALGLEYTFQQVDLLNRGHLKEEFIQKNPQHTVPVLEDDGQCIWDSHAIAAYLVRKYGKNDSLYPKDYYQRAVVDQRLHFETGVLFPAVRNISYPLIFLNDKDITKAKLDAVEEVYKLLEVFLEHDYIAGDHVTVADFSIECTLTCSRVFLPVDRVKFPKLFAWHERMTELPYYASTQNKGVEFYKQLVRSKLGQN